jgi:hypothetical protein
VGWAGELGHLGFIPMIRSRSPALRWMFFHSGGFA